MRSTDWKPEIKIKVEDNSTAFDICDQISNETNILEEERPYYTLILLSATTSLRRLGSKIHCMRTLRSEELVLKAYEEMSERVPSKISRHGASGYSNSQDVATESTYKWIFKDTRSVPLDFGDEADLSGDESSDDEQELLPGDLQYIRQSDRKAFMLKRSRKDPNCWKKRYCVITDKFWCINTKYESPRAICLSLNSSVKIFDVRPAYNYQNAVILKESSGSYYFRAASPVDQQNWINELTTRISYQTDHETIHLAEFIACDEELAMCNRQQKATATITHSNIFRYVLSEVSNENIWMALSSGNLSEVLHSNDSSNGARSRKQSALTSSPTSSFHDSTKQRSGDLPAPLTFAAVEDPVQTDSPLATPREGDKDVYESRSVRLVKDRDNKRELDRSVESSNSVDSEPRRAERQSLLSSSSLLSSNPHSRYTNRSTSLALSLRIHRRGMQWLWDGMRNRHPLLMRSMQFLQAVQFYRDMHRHDVEQPPRHIWMVLVNIYHSYLSQLKLSAESIRGFALEQLQDPEGKNQAPAAADEEESVEWLPSPTAWRESGTPTTEPTSSFKSRPLSGSTKPVFQSPHLSSKSTDINSSDVVTDESTIWNIKSSAISRVLDCIESHKPKASRFMSKIRPNSISQFMGSAAASLAKMSENPDKTRNSRPETLVSDVTISDGNSNGDSGFDGRPSTMQAVDTRASSQGFFSSWFGSNTSNLFNTNGTASTASNSDHREQSLLSAARSSIVNPATQSYSAPPSVAKKRGSVDVGFETSKAAKRLEFEADLYNQYINYDFDTAPPSINILDDLLLEVEKRVINCTTRVPFNLNCRLRDSSSFRGLGADSDSMSVYSNSTQNDPLRPKARRFGFVFRKKFVPSSTNAPQQNAARQSYSRLKNIFEMANGQGARLMNTVVTISKEGSQSARNLLSTAANSGKSVFSDAASRYSMLRLKSPPSVTPPREYRMSTATIEGDAPGDEEGYEDAFDEEEEGMTEPSTLQTYLELVEDIATAARNTPRTQSGMKKTFSKSEFSSTGSNLNSAAGTPVGSPRDVSGNANKSAGSPETFHGIPANRPMSTNRTSAADSIDVSNGLMGQWENVAGNRTSLVRSQWDSSSEGRPSEMRSLDTRSESESATYLRTYREEDQLSDRFGDMSFHFEPYTGSRTPSTQSPQKLSGLVGITPEDRESYVRRVDDDDDEDLEREHEVTG